MIISGTGHRPNRLGGYSSDVFFKLVDTAKKALVILEPETVLSGMAIGWDTALAVAALELNIRLECAIPFKGQESIWNKDTKEVYFQILDKADKITYVCEPGYAAWKLLKRNVFMNETSDQVLALYDITHTTGGTAHCIKDALKRNKIVQNSWGIFTGESEQLTLINPNHFNQ